MCRSRNTTSRFRLPCSKENVEKVLRAAVRSEVHSRGGKPQLDGEMAEIVSRVAECLTSDSRKFGLMFSGQCGNGKSTMTRAVARAVKYFVQLDKLDGINLRMLVVSAKSLVSCKPEYREEAQRLRLLAIEDLGNEPAERNDYGNITNPIVDLLEFRYDNQLYTVITTNLTPQQITDKYGVRIADRFREMLDIVVFKGGSFRK